MQVHTRTKNLVDDEKMLFEDYLEKKMEKFERLIGEFDEDMVKLDVNIEKFNKNEAFKVEMVMELPKARTHRPLHSSEDSRDIRKAIDLAQDKMLVQMKKAIEKMHHEHQRAA